MDIDQVFSDFCLLAGIDETQSSPWRGLCEAAISHVLSILRPGVDQNQHQMRLCMAAAGCAFARYRLVQDATQAGFKIGEFSMNQNVFRPNQAAALEQEFLKMIDDLILSEWVVFRQVELNDDQQPFS